MDNQIIINNIKKLCKDNGITISQLEKDLFLSPGLISRWSKSTPSLERIIDIANYFNVTLDAIAPTNASSDEDTTNIRPLMKTLYEKSLNAEIEWSVLNAKKMPQEFLHLSSTDQGILQMSDCYYTKINEGYFFLQTLYSTNEQINLSFYALADKYSRLKLLSTNIQELDNLYKYLRRRLSHQLNTIKTNNFIDSVLISLNSSENENKISDNITSIAVNS